MQIHYSENIGFKANPWPLDEDRPTLVLIHGSGQDSGFWVHQMAAFEPVANVVALDLPGHGDSQGQGMESLPGYAQEVMAFIERIKALHPIPAGLSLGGAIVLQMLLDYPDRLAGGILMNTGARLRVQQEIFDRIQADFSGFLDYLRTLALSPQSNADLLWPRVLECTTASPDVTVRDYRACNNFDVMERLGTVRTPVLVLTATDDYLTPPKYGQFMADNIPHARLVSIGHAGHFAPFEKPAEVNRALAGYLESIDL
jgi:pimeloyl-ACP methyl ester carboxylesterase